jgi:hypothetical protein
MENVHVQDAWTKEEIKSVGGKRKIYVPDALCDVSGVIHIKEEY